MTATKVSDLRYGDKVQIGPGIVWEVLAVEESAPVHYPMLPGWLVIHWVHGAKSGLMSPHTELEVVP